MSEERGFNRRNFAAVALAGTAAACTTIKNPNGTTTIVVDPAVQSVFNSIQFVLPLLDVLAAGIAVAVPAAAPAVAAVTPYLNAAGTVFQTLQVTMTKAQAQPIVQQIEGYVSGAVTAAQNVIATTPSLAGLAPKVQQAQAVLGLLTTFVNGVVPAAALAKAPVALPPLLHR